MRRDITIAMPQEDFPSFQGYLSNSQSSSEGMLKVMSPYG